MAPLNFSDNIGIYSLVGTWLGTLFTLVGLIAVITQLRSLLNDFAVGRKKRAQTAAGDWAICIPSLRPSDAGLIEAAVPPLAPWIKNFYTNGGDIVVSPYQRNFAGGQASWTRLFSCLQIHPDLLRHLGVKATSSSAEFVPRAPQQADLLVNRSKISYGMSGSEFAAILILSGFSPSNFKLNSTSSDTSHLGGIHLGPHDTFSQVAQFGGSLYILKDNKSVDTNGRFTHRLNVRHCIDISLGILRFDFAGQARMLVVGPEDCFATPSPQRLLAVRRNLTHLTQGSAEDEPLFDVPAAAMFDFYGRYVTNTDWHHHFRNSLSENNFLGAAMKVAVTISALRPWGILPVLPRSIPEALLPILKDAFPKLQLQGGDPVILTKFRESSMAIYNIPGWTKTSMDPALNSLREVQTQGFLGQSSKCTLYFDVMNSLFQCHNISLEAVEIGLAAYCASRFLARASSKAVDGENPALPQTNQDLTEWHREVEEAIRERLNGVPMDTVAPWAYEILATYIQAWLRGSKHIEDDFRNNFRRRVFLG